MKRECYQKTVSFQHLEEEEEEEGKIKEEQREGGNIKGEVRMKEENYIRAWLHCV